MVVVAGLGTASAQLSLTGTSYTQDFDGLGTGTISSVTGGNLGTHSSTLTGWFFLESGSNANTTITAGTGSLTTGDTYNFGLAAGSDRALGGLQTGSLVPTWGFYLTNGTGSAITAFDIAYTGETWRVGAASRSDRIDFQYSLDATSLTTGTWVDFNGLDYANPGQATGSGSVQHSASIAGTISSLTILSGENFFIRWTDFNPSGSDDGMAVDGFSLTATLSAGSPNLYWLGADTTRGGSGTWANSGGPAWSTTDADGSGIAWDSTKTAIFNTAAASVTVSGTVDADKGITFATGSDGSTVTGGTAIDLGGATAADNTITTASGITATIGTILTGSNGMTKSGAGTLALTGNNSGLSGAVALNAGTVQVGLNGALGTGTVTIGSGATLATNDSTARTLANNVVIGGDVTLGQSSGGTGDLAISGTVDLGLSNRGIVVNNSLVDLQGSVSGTGGINKSGTGTLRFSNASNPIGTLDVNGGLVGIHTGASVTSTMSLGSTSWDGGLTGAGSLNLNNSATTSILQLNSTVDSSGYSGTVTHSGGGEINVRSTLSPLGTGQLRIATTDTIIRASGTTQTGQLANSSIALNPNGDVGFELNIGATGGNSLTVGAITEAGAGASNVLFQSGTAPGGAGTLTINGASSYGGTTSFNGATSFTFKNGITNALPTATVVTMGASSGQGGTWDLNGFNQTVGGLNSGAGSGVITNNGAGPSTLTVSNSSASSFEYVIGDGTATTALTKAGSGTLTLSGDNTYTGTTSVNAGTLIINGDQSAATGDVTVASGATLGGVGSMGGDASFESGSTLAPGTTTGNISQALDFSTLTMEVGSIWLVDLVNAITNDADMITVNTSGGLSISGALSINEVSGLYTPGTSYRIAAYSGALGGAGVFSNDSGGFITNGVNTWAINYNDGGYITLNSTAVPEPGTITLLGLGLGGLIARRIRKRKAAQAA